MMPQHTENKFIVTIMATHDPIWLFREERTHKPLVGGSNPPSATRLIKSGLPLNGWPRILGSRFAGLRGISGDELFLFIGAIS